MSEGYVDRPADVIALPERQMIVHKTPKAGSTAIHRTLWRDNPKIAIADIPAFWRAVAIVRHPLARLVSCYRSKIAGKLDRWITVCRSTGEVIPGLHSGLSFVEFCDVVYKYPYANRHWMPQSRWLDLGNGLPEIAKLEEMPASWERFGLPALPVVNQSGKYHWQDCYDVPLRTRMSDVFRDDLDLFGYAE